MDKNRAGVVALAMTNLLSARPLPSSPPARPYLSRYLAACVSTACLGFMITSHVSAEELYNLRGTDTKGMTIRFEEVSTIKDGKLKITANERVINGEILKLVDKDTQEHRILEVQDGKTSKVRIKIIEDSTTEAMKINGELEGDKRRGPLVGMNVIATLKGGTWVGKLKKKAKISKEEAWETESLTHLLAMEDTVYLDQKIPIGHTWTIKAEDLKGMFGSKVDTIKGGAKLTFEKIEMLKGVKTARIQAELDVDVTYRDADDHNITSKVKGSGVTNRSLDTFIDVRDEMTSTVEGSRSVKNGDAEIFIEMSGTLIVEKSAKIKVAKKKKSKK